MLRRTLLAGAAVAATSRRGGAQPAFPSRPIRLVVAFPAGGPTDVLARIVAARMAAEFSQPIVIENRGGANGNIAADHVAKSDPDGHTILYNTSSIAIGRSLYRALPFDVLRDLAPVALTAAAPLALVVHPGVPVQDAAGFIAWARANSGRISYSSAGVGNISHLLSFLVTRHIGVEATHVPYRGTAAALTDTAAGNVQFVSDAVATSLPVIQDGRVRAIAVSSAEASPQLPGVPSMQAVGLMPPGYDVGIWQAMMVPARTPPAVIERLNAAVNVALADDGVRARLAALGARPTGGPPADYAALLRLEIDRWADIVRASGASAE